MLSVADAQEIVLRHTHPLSPTILPLTSAALGRILAEDVCCDRDMPPYTKALMDGYAVRTADFVQGEATLLVVEEIIAGRVPTKALGPGKATRIMTGAPLPTGADAVIKVEQTRSLDGDRVHLHDDSLRPNSNIMPQGREMQAGETILTAGSLLRPQEFGLLATVGRTAVRVYPAPTVAVLSTGDEVVEAGQTPGPGQIRNGNGPTLCAQVCQAGGLVRYLGIARDTLPSLRSLVAEGLNAEVLVLSGGVSAGTHDLVPGVLQEAGVQAHFHKVAMKPGKPVLFGTLGSRLVFGLPGNPVSALVCFELFVRPALRRLAGHPEGKRPVVKAHLAGDFPYKTDRPTYFPARLELTDTGYRVQPVPWFGSPDLRALTRANALCLLPPGDHQHKAGQVFEVLRLEG